MILRHFTCMVFILLQEIDELYHEHFGQVPVRGNNYENRDESFSEDQNDQSNETIHTTERLRLLSAEINNESDNRSIQSNSKAADTFDNDLNDVEAAFTKGCCSSKSHECLNQFDLKEIKENIFLVREMTKSERDMYIMGSLSYVNTKDLDNTEGKRKRTRCSFSFKSRSVCRECLKLCFDIGEKYFRNLKMHMDKNGAVHREHGNAGVTPKHAIKYEDSKRVADFLMGYANEFGLPQPAAPRGRDEDPPIFLSSSETILKLHEKYKSALDVELHRVLGVSSFRDIWKKCCPQIKIAGPKDDVCGKCEKIKQLIIDSTTDEDKLKYTNELKTHVELSIAERAVYKTSVQNAYDELHNVERPEGQIPPNSTNYRNMHYTFDFSQHFLLPHRCRQIGAMYFVTARKVHMFGVRFDGVPLQYNYLIDEDQSIGQNKNMYVLAYLCWRVMTGLHDNINYMMQIPGHARCLIDAGFAHSKKVYRRTDADVVQHVADVVNKSAFSNVAVLKHDENGQVTWHWKDWKSFLSGIFKPLNGIKQYQHFRFSKDHPGFVFIKKSKDDTETKKDLLKSRNINVPDMPPPSIIPEAGFSAERKKYLFRTVRQYIRPAFQDQFCASEFVDEE